MPPKNPRLLNAFMTAILRSPLHNPISKAMMLISVTGRKTGKIYTTPVSYIQDGDTLSIMSGDYRMWWHNLRGGAPVTVRLRGQDRRGVADVLEQAPDAIAAVLTDYFRRLPPNARIAGVPMDAQGCPDPAAVQRVARETVIVRVKLD